MNHDWHPVRRRVPVSFTASGGAFFMEINMIAQNGRDVGGRFTPGNKFGAGGNPHARKVAALRAQLFQAVQPEDIAQIANVLLVKAKAGDLDAIRELLDRLLGKPASGNVMERISNLESMLADIEQRIGQ